MWLSRCELSWVRLSRCDSFILAIKCGTGEGDKKRVSCCVALEMGHKAGVVPGIEANPMWVLKSKSTQVRVFSSFPHKCPILVWNPAKAHIIGRFWKILHKPTLNVTVKLRHTPEVHTQDLQCFEKCSSTTTLMLLLLLSTLKTGSSSVIICLSCNPNIVAMLFISTLFRHDITVEIILIQRWMLYCLLLLMLHITEIVSVVDIVRDRS